MPTRPIRVESTETHERAQELLRSIGFSHYEARCYITLIGATKALNGYEVAKVSGVPRSAVYESLQKLVARGAAMEVAGEEGETSAFVGLPADTFIERLRNGLSGTLDSLASVLPAMSNALSSSVVAHLTGVVQIRERFNAIMEKSRSSCLLAVWPPGAEDVRGIAERLVARGVDVTSIIYGDFPGFPGRSFQHRFENPMLLREVLGIRCYVVVADQQEALIGIREGDRNWGLWSDDLAVVTVAQQFVLYDIVIQEMAAALVSSGATAELDCLLREHHERMRKVVSRFSDSPRGLTMVEGTAATTIGQGTRKRRSV